MSINIQTIGEFRKYIMTELKSLYPPEEIDSIINIIVKTLFNTDRLHLLSDPRRLISGSEADKIPELVSQLTSGKPVQYVLGETDFHGCKIKVNNNVLIPRQETEELADLIIKENRGCPARIADIGTGSGCIAIALAKNLPESEIIAIDNSESALETARINMRVNDVRIEFIHEDIFSFNSHSLYPLDIIVSNPPYVRLSEKKYMHRNVLEFEPESALFVPDNDPLLFYRKIFELSESSLIRGGRVYFEINEAMGKKIIKMAEHFHYIELLVIKDLNGKDRIVKGIYNGR